MAKVIYDNTGEEIEVENGKNLKDLTSEKGWNVAYGCEDGFCGTCLVELVEGAENLSKIDDVEETTLTAMGLLDGKHRLACQCKINGDIKIKTL